MSQSINKIHNLKKSAISLAVFVTLLSTVAEGFAVNKDNNLLMQVPADFLPPTLDGVAAGRIDIDRGSINNPFAIEHSTEAVDKEVEAAIDGIIGDDLEVDSAEKEAAATEDATNKANFFKEVSLDISVENDDNVSDFEYMKVAYEAMQAGQYEGAASYYKKILLNSPDNETALFAIASLYQQSGQVKLAKRYYKKLLKVNRHHQGAWHNLVVLMSQQSSSGAVAQLEELRKVNPEFSLISAQLGMTYHKQGKNKKAIEALIRASIQSSENMQYRYLLANVLDRSGYTNEAIKVYSSLLLMASKSPSIELPASREVIEQRVNDLRDRRLNISSIN